MEKKVYICPLSEVETINLSRCLLEGSDPKPTPPPVPVPQRHSPVLGNDSVQVF